MENLLHKHPCFDNEARKTSGRLHLPIAAGCNVQCHYCNRKYDCPNESRPGVSSVLLSPEEALAYAKEATKRMPHIAVVGIAGPGDPFATPEITLKTFQLIRSEFPGMVLCAASNGLAVAPHVPELKELGVSHVTLTVNAVYPTIGAQIYAWVRKDKKVHRGVNGASALLDNQETAVTALSAAGIAVKINSIVMPGINQDHIIDIAKWAKPRGASIMNCIPVYPVKDTVFEEMKPPTKAGMEAILAEVGTILPVMRHCTRCRADAAGLIACGTTQDTVDLLRSVVFRSSEKRPYVAVASREGLLINQHLGEADSLYVFELEDAGRIREVARRVAPRAGGGDARWESLVQILTDCRVVLVSDVGDRPRRIIESKGIEVIATEGMIEEAVRAIFQDKPVPHPIPSFRGCKRNCKGEGLGCG